MSVSDDGAVVVPLLGGHRGANRLASKIADALVPCGGDDGGRCCLGVALDEPPVAGPW